MGNTHVWCGSAPLHKGGQLLPSLCGGVCGGCSALTALGSPTASFCWSADAQASFDALKVALSSAPVLRTFDPSRLAVLTTDASGLAAEWQQS